MASICANLNGLESCPKTGRFTCKGCLLVSYCGPQCQKKHWSAHKKCCKSDLMKKTWTPAWAREGRVPGFMADGSLYPFGGKKYLWGNVPALDILNLDKNEGEAYDKDLNMLFAASGDLRNAIKSLISIPESFGRRALAVLNDNDFDIVARNAIMLLLSLVVDGPEEAAIAITHIWYSGFILEGHLDLLRGRIRPLIAEVCTKIAGKSRDNLLGKTWTFGTCDLRLVLKKEDWEKLLRYFDVPDGLTFDQANKVRKSITLAEDRRDWRERRYLSLSPAQRLGAQRYREDGLLLPFAADRRMFQVPNPTMFQEADQWPLKDSADPLEGWDWKEVSENPPGPATSDRYGMLYSYLQALLRRFYSRLRSVNVSLQLYHMNATELPQHVEHISFSRIEVSNIGDRAYLGCPRCLATLSPLLQHPSDNPHATFLMLFMNAVDDEITPDDKMDEIRRTFDVRRKYLRMPSTIPYEYDPRSIMFDFALSYFQDFDKYFKRYMATCMFEETGSMCGMRMKKKHTIVDKWPMRLKLQQGQPGAQEEFDLLQQSGHTGSDRYVEWKRVRS